MPTNAIIGYFSSAVGVHPITCQGESIRCVDTSWTPHWLDHITRTGRFSPTESDAHAVYKSLKAPARPAHRRTA